MFLSPKTIEYHLRNVYRKVGVNSRGELRAVLSSAPGSGADPATCEPPSTRPAAADFDAPRPGALPCRPGRPTD